MEIRERAAGSAIVVSLNGRLDGFTAPDLEARVLTIIARGRASVVLDCSSMRYVSSAGLRAFVVCARICRKAGGKLTLAAVQDDCRSVLEMSGFLSVIDYHDTAEAALAAPDDVLRGGGEEEPEAEGKPGLELEERRVGSAVVVSLTGRLDGFGALGLEAGIRTFVQGGDVRVVLDCAGMTYVSSAGLRGLLVCVRHCQREGGRLVMAALRHECHSILAMSGFLSFIDCYESSEAALRALAPGTDH